MKRYFLSSLLLIFSWFCYGLTDIPEFAHRVIDTTQTLTDSQKESLESSLIGFEKPRTDGAQIAVLMISKLDDETVEQYADRVFIQWKIGRKGQDNGILLLIVKDDKLMRIEVGYGLEGTITDLVASKIIREQLAPQFRQNNYYQGIDNALSVLKQKIDNPSPKCEDNEQGLRIEQLFTENFAYYALVSFVICFILAKLLYRKDKTKQCFRTGLFNALSVAGYTLWHVEYILEIAFLMFVIMCVVFCLSTMASGILTPGAGGGGNNRGGSGGFGGSSGGSRGGGFSGGGGGRSGGGGASGRW
ncbi:YgcG family protein [Gilliamella sp. ESL0443]|uniref:TPM domain-containing protein n=1 Tax=Gilliamella sp. ESL0443 TaxID=2704655 RepID=UPI001C6991D9|nr:TPM domain-containing protein [Gilliamella sp. ESL0443]QYN41322.1 hypothetical protein GYM76_00535 [Gilliamella sp. ESL0443]